jgi:hypothetical protein
MFTPHSHWFFAPALRRAACLALVWALAGCASVMRIDNQVDSYAKWAPGALPEIDVSYEFERLPSQTGPDAQAMQTELERLGAEALLAHGWRLSGHTGAAPWRVQLSARTDKLPRAPWENPADNWPHAGFWAGPGSAGLRMGPIWHIEQPYFLRTVSVVVRNSASGQVMLETSARHDGRWNDSPALWRAMLDAALNGFPQQPAGVRQVDIDIPR